MSLNKTVNIGISRFCITDKVGGRGASRFTDSQRYWPIANALYRSIFTKLGIPLLPDEELIKCTLQEFQAGYDYQLGIDVILRPEKQGESTMQEKFLFTDFDTVTIEHCQDWLTLEPGDWYKLKAQYYFVGYDFKQQSKKLNPWILLDWSRLQRATAQGRVKWQLRANLKDGAQASFMYLQFDKLPPDIIVACSNRAYSLF